MDASSNVAPAPAEVRVLATGLAFPEGPLALPDGRILWCEIRGGTVRQLAPDGSVTLVANCGGGPNGLALGPDGAVYVCNNGGNRYHPDQLPPLGPAPDYAGGFIQRIDLATGAVRTLYTHCGGRRLSSPNDLVFDAEGGMYFTDFGKKHASHRDHGGLYYARADGGHIVELAYPVASPNGIGLAPDGRTLYVAETDAARLWAFRVLGPGRLGPPEGNAVHGAGRLVRGFAEYQLLDSLAVDAAGNVCVAALFAGCIQVVSPAGTLLRSVPVPDRFPTNICFGGPGLRTAYVTLAGSGALAAIPWTEPGLPLQFHCAAPPSTCNPKETR
jgi:gluconolactonase